MLNESAPSLDASQATVCATCGLVIGVYEPMIIVSPWGDPLETSLAQLPELDADDKHYHPACYSW